MASTDPKKWQPAASVDAVRDELSSVVLWTMITCGAAEIDGRTMSAGDVGKQRAAAFTVFGVKSGLIDPATGNRWLDAVFGRNGVTLADVFTPPEAATAPEGTVDA